MIKDIFIIQNFFIIISDHIHLFFNDISTFSSS